MKLYKLTNQENKTYGGMNWGEGISHKLPRCKNPELCGPTVLHAYKDPNLALLLNPIHANIKNPVLWEAEGAPCVEDWGKCGCFKLTITKKIELPQWYQNHREKVQIQFAILCAESVLHCYESKYPEDDRPRKAIEAARNYLEKKKSAAYAAARAARAAAAARAYAAVRAADAAYAAARAARAADAADAADAAYAAARAADAAADAADIEIDFCELADQAVRMIEEGE